MNYIVNSCELAGHARALQRSKHQLPFPYRKKEPLSVPTLFGEKIKTRNSKSQSQKTNQIRKFEKVKKTVISLPRSVYLFMFFRILTFLLLF